MPTLGQHTIHEFRLQSRSDLVAALDILIRARKQAMAESGEAIGGTASTDSADNSAGRDSSSAAAVSEDKILKYAEIFFNIVNNPTPAMPLGAIDSAILDYFDADLAQIFANGSADKELQESFAIQMAMLAAATGNADGLTPYTVDELKSVFAGEGAVYHDTIFLHTLRYLITSDSARECAPYIIKTLPAKENREDNFIQMFWDDALVFSMLLHVAWRCFAWHAQAGQQFLLQNYLYQALVVGVPVRYWLHDAIVKTPAGGARALINFFQQSINGNREEIAIDPIEGDGIPLNEGVKEYMRRLTSEQMPTMVQEAYLAALYPDVDVRSALGPWVRELLAIIVHLKDGTV